jgi:hypothetical protein
LRPWRNPRSCSRNASGDWLWRNPTTGIAGCCARAANGHAAAPPSSVTNSRASVEDSERLAKILFISNVCAQYKNLIPQLTCSSWYRGAESPSRDTRYQLREQELQALGKISAPRQERRSRARSRLAIHLRRFLVPSRIAFRRCRLDRYGESNNTLNFYNLMTIRTYRNAFHHLTRDLVWRKPQSDCFRNSKCLALRIPVMEFQNAGISVLAAKTF